MNIQQYYQRQVSFTEWFEQIKHVRTAEMRGEDNEKRERLKVLNEIIGLPFDKPVQFDAAAVIGGSSLFKEYIAQHGNELCAMRLIPRDHSLPKLRIRGKSVYDSLAWFREQNIDPKSYRVDFVPHSEEVLWSTCFVVNGRGIFGEIISGQHTHLTQGFYDDAHQPIAFYYDWDDWRLTEDNPEMLSHLKEIVQFLRASRTEQDKLKNALNAEYSHDYLHGYFETVACREFGTWFIDYNRMIGEMYRDFAPIFPPAERISKDSALTGMPASGGVARGTVKIVTEQDIQTAVFNAGDILVCDMTSPHYVPLMQKAVAIVTDRGGILSHAAIVSRELGKPCITGTKNATKILHDGDIVEVDANQGVVRKVG